MKPTQTIWCLAVLVCLVLFTGTVSAQGVTTAAINGKVTAKTGEALPGVNIVAIHDPSGTKYGNSTREDGRFTIPNLRVGGPYTVSASIIGYQKQTRTQIYLQLSQNLDLNFSLTEEAVQGGEVTVIGQREPLFNSSRTGAATNVTRDQIDKLPTMTRNFQDAYKLSPYFAEGNALGRNNKYNNIQIDGANFNDLYGLGATGAPAGQGPGKLAPVSLDAIEEFQIVVSPFDVRQGNFTGAGINAISRSGTNTPKGSMYYYGRNEGLVGKSPDTLKKKLDGFSDWQYGFRAGGAIVENNLFYFVNGEFTRFDQPISRTFGNKAIGTNAYTASQDSLNLLTNHLKTKYGYDPGSFSLVPNLRETDKIFTRLDYNINENQKLTARWSYLRSAEDNSPSRGRGLTDIYFENGRYRLDNKTHNLGLQLTSVFGNSTSNELILGYVDQFDNPIFYGAAFPTIYISTIGSGVSQNLILGAEEFRHRNELGQKYFEVTDNFSWYLPSHTITAGVRVDFLKFRNLFIADNYGAYAYSSIARFLQDLPANGAVGFSAYTYKYSATADPLQESRWGARQYGFYVQDEFTVTSRLKLTAGVRMDLPTYPDKPLYNKAVDSTYGLRTDEPPKTSLAFSPRVGFNLSLDEDRTMQVRGGAGIFYGRFPYVWVGNQYAGTGVDFVTINNIPTRFNPDPYGQAKAAAAASATYEISITDHNFKAPSVIRGSLAFDYKLPFDLVASVEGIYSTTQNDVYYENINLKGQQENGGLTPGGVLVGENREVWGVWNTQRNGYAYRNLNQPPRTDTLSTGYMPVNARFAPGVFLIKNTNKGSNANVVVQVQRNVAEGVNGGASYTWGIAKDISSGNSTTASSGWRFNPTSGNPNAPELTYSQWDRRHHISANVSYRHEWAGLGYATTLGLIYNGLSGRPFSYLVVGDVNGDGRSDNDLVYIPKDVNDIILMGLRNPDSVGGPGNQIIKLTDKTRREYGWLMNFIEGDDYLKANKGKIAERSGPREPWTHQLDLHFAQEIPTYAGQRIEFTFDITNFLNLLNKEWGWVRNTGINQNYSMITFNSIETTAGVDRGKPRYTVAASSLKVTDGKADPYVPDNLLSRWQAQFGIRYTF